MVGRRKWLCKQGHSNATKGRRGSRGSGSISNRQAFDASAVRVRTAYLAPALGHGTEYLDPVVPGKPS